MESNIEIDGDVVEYYDNSHRFIKRKKRYDQKFNSLWKKELYCKDWIQHSSKGEFFAHCKVCETDISVRSGKQELRKHAEGKKHLHYLLLQTGNYPSDLQHNGSLTHSGKEAPCEKYELTSEGNVDSDADQSMPNIHCEPLSSPMKATTTVPQTPSNSSGLENKTLDAICTFYKNINTPSRTSTADLEDSDEAFGRYLGKELKSFQNATVKRKLKQKILNMVYNTEDEPENAQMRPFPIFVSTQGGIPFVQSNKIPKTDL